MGGPGLGFGKGPYGEDFGQPRAIGVLTTSPITVGEPKEPVERPKPPVLCTGRKIRESNINQENTHGNT